MRTPLSSARVLDADPGSDLSAPDLDDTGWLAVAVPGDLHRALEAAGRLPQLDHGTSTDAAAWVEEREWWYRLDVPHGGRLVCEGLDTLATVYLDGRVIGESSNMHHPFEADLDSGGLLAICFHRCPEDPTHLRKAQFGFGWDFAPRRPSVGIWQPVSVGDVASIEGVRFTTLSVQPAVVEIEVEAAEGTFTATVAGVTGQADVGDRLRLELGDVALWSPDDPVLHELVIELDGEVDRRQVGVRTVLLDRTDGFRFKVNDRWLFARGANWVPPDTALADTDPQRVTELLEAAKAAGMNMVRVWGGGVYASDHFYETCDRLGLLVWQDFMFAGKEYRGDTPGFAASVEREARHQVRRLRTHPSLALWCGNNEVDLLAGALDWGDPSPAREIFYELLPRVVAEEDGRTDYTPTSPVEGQDRHNWHVWHGIAEPVDLDDPALLLMGPPLSLESAEGQAFVDAAAPENYLRDTSRFLSEYGLCGMSTWETLQRWTAPEDLVLGSAAVAKRSSDSRLGPRNKVDLLVHGLVGEPRDLRHLTALSHWLQAEGVKVGVEHYRRSWPHCGGSLVWQLNDCWPATSWSVIDVEGRKKPVYDVIARAYAPTLLSFGPDGSLWVTTDVDVEDELVVRSTGFDGEVRWEQRVSVAMSALGSLEVARFDVDGTHSSYLSVQGMGTRNRQCFPRPKDLVRPVAEVTVDGLTVTTDAYAFQVQTAAGESFDLEPGESRQVLTTDGLYWL